MSLLGFLKTTLWSFLYQNDSEWPEMDFKHNFENCEILSLVFWLCLCGVIIVVKANLCLFCLHVVLCHIIYLFLRIQ